jgi:hypothetical protein
MPGGGKKDAGKAKPEEKKDAGKDKAAAKGGDKKGKGKK